MRSSLFGAYRASSADMSNFFFTIARTLRVSNLDIYKFADLTASKIDGPHMYRTQSRTMIASKRRDSWFRVGR